MTHVSKKVSVVEIKCPLGVMPPAMYCPRTGRMVLASDDALPQPASPYVTFIYVHDAEAFEYLREDLQERLDARKEAWIAAGIDEYDLPCDFEILMEEVDLGMSPLIYEITTRSMACGPVWSTVVAGFDLWSEEDEEGDEDEE